MYLNNSLDNELSGDNSISYTTSNLQIGYA
jgi:hypothetical protein